MTTTPKITISHEFHGMSDYWSGNSRRWDVGAGCLFAFYGPDTSLRDCVDQWVSDVWQGGDFEHHGDGPNPYADISDSDIREAIVTSLLNDRGRADYKSGALCEFAAECEDERVCDECSECIGGPHKSDCVYLEDGAIRDVDPDDCDDDDDCNESPQWIILVEIDVCSECGVGCDHTIDDFCAGCGAKHYPSHFNDVGELIV